MTRSALALLLFSAVAATAEELQADLSQAEMLCMGHVTTVCMTNPPFPCEWEKGWQESCSEIERRIRELNRTNQKQREQAEQEKRDLDFVRGVAGEASAPPSPDQR